MAKPEVIETPEIDRVAEAREHVQAAAQLLKNMGGEYSRLSWMLEDFLGYFDGSPVEEDYTDDNSAEALKRLARLVNVR